MIQIDKAKFLLGERTHWKYYLELETELLSTRKYVDFDVANHKTFSIEYLKLYQAVCSEIDVFGKTLAVEINPFFEPKDSKNSIFKWWYEIQPWYDSLTNKRVSFCGLFDIDPWTSFEVETYQDKKGAIRYRIKDSKRNHTPVWWKEYTEVKHQRSFTDKIGMLNYQKANLGNLCYAIAGLYILENNYFDQVGDSKDKAYMEKSKIFEPHFSSYYENGVIVCGNR